MLRRGAGPRLPCARGLGGVRPRGGPGASRRRPGSRGPPRGGRTPPPRPGFPAPGAAAPRPAGGSRGHRLRDPLGPSRRRRGDRGPARDERGRTAALLRRARRAAPGRGVRPRGDRRWPLPPPRGPAAALERRGPRGLGLLEPAAPRVPRLRRGRPRGVVRAADPGPADGEARAPAAPGPSLAVYHAVPAEASRLLGLLGDPAVHAALLPEGWAVEQLSRRADGFERTLVEEGKLLRSERVTLRPDGITVDAEGPLALFPTRTWRLEPRPFGTRLRLLATLREPLPPRGLPEGTRRRLVFELASELLAVDRHAAEA